MIKFDLKNTDWERIRDGLSKYSAIMKSVKDSSIRNDKEFQRGFNGFYRIRQRPRIFYDALYDYLETNKNRATSFEQTLTFFHKKFQRVEPSFSSKIVATINPDLPVWDTEVLSRLGLRSPNRNLNKKARFDEMIKTYHKIVDWYAEFIKTDQARAMLKAFDEKFGDSNITDIKKIDLILWQTRS